jgi:hypothetical protein
LLLFEIRFESTGWLVDGLNCKGYMFCGHTWNHMYLCCEVNANRWLWNLNVAAIMICMFWIFMIAGCPSGGWKCHLSFVLALDNSFETESPFTHNQAFLVCLCFMHK